MELVKTENAKGRGRPPLYDVEMVRGSFRVPVETLDTLKLVGEGNVTRAIIALAKRWQEESERVIG